MKIQKDLKTMAITIITQTFQIKLTHKALIETLMNLIKTNRT